MACRECDSRRIIDINAKCSDMFVAETPVISYSGYVPSDINLGGDDYISFQLCLDCGMVQDDFPVQSEQIPYFSVSDFYEDGVCPDCQHDIPEDVAIGDSCENCGHVFTVDPEDMPKNTTLNC